MENGEQLKTLTADLNKLGFSVNVIGGTWLTIGLSDRDHRAYGVTADYKVEKLPTVAEAVAEWGTECYRDGFSAGRDYDRI